MAKKSVESRLIQLFSEYEYEKKINGGFSDILPGWMTRHQIIIKCNNEVVFDSFANKDHRIPLPIQYTIRRYGYPDKAYNMRKRNKPIIYNIDTNILAID